MDVVADWMNPRPKSVDVDARVDDLRQLMLVEGFHHALVLEQGRVMGIISDREVLQAVSHRADGPYASRHEHAMLEKRAHQIMARAPVTIARDAAMGEAAEMLLAHRIHCLPVFHRYRCVGILTSGDVMRWAVALAAAVERPSVATGGFAGS